MSEKICQGRLVSVLLCVLALLCTAFIWSNSAKPAVASSGQSMMILAQVKDGLLSLGFEEEILHTLVRKAAHVAEFALLGFLWLAFAERQWAYDLKFARLLAFALSLMTAVIDETIQLGFEGRAGMIQDLWVDMIGIILGTLAIGVLLAWNRAKR